MPATVEDVHTRERTAFRAPGRDSALTVGFVLNTYIRPLVHPGELALRDAGGTPVGEAAQWNEVAWPADGVIALTCVPYVRAQDASGRFDGVFNEAEAYARERFGDLAGVVHVMFAEREHGRVDVVVTVREAEAGAFAAQCAELGVAFPLPHPSPSGCVVIRVEKIDAEAGAFADF